MGQPEYVAIVGAGPAGAYCALELAKFGIFPTIYDYSHPREKPCGGGISPHVLQMFPFVEKFRSLGLTFSDFRIISCTGHQVITKSLANGFSISRRCFDEGILNMAIQNGAKLIREKVIDIQKAGKFWKIETSKDVISTNILVGADGVNSLVRRKIIGPITKENLALAFGYRTTSIEKHAAAIKFLGEIPGYIWVFPGKDYANIGIGSELKFGGVLKKLLDAFVVSYCPQIRIESKYAALLPSARSPDFFRSIPVVGHNWILIGDAAGHVDPISGGGILYALWGGKLAAKAIRENDLKLYDRHWREQFGIDLENRCKTKNEYYDPVKLEVSLLCGLIDNTYF